jgi:hypothetical protein
MQTTIFNNTISDELSQDICNQHRFHLLNARKKNSYCTEENGKRKITKTIRTRNKKKKEKLKQQRINIINQNVSESFTEKDPEKMAWVNEIRL